MPFGIEEQVLGLEVAVCYSLAVQIRHTSEDLLEATLHLAGRHAAFLDGSIEVSSGTELHDFAPALLLILHEIHRLDYVDVMQRR